VIDFQGYWVHRWAHKINFFWNKHAIHHSSEEFNLAVALRQSISSFVSLFSFFLLPAALLGVPTIVISTVAPIHLFAQFWYHTRHIGRMGFLEHIIVTPSHHRVHHALNPEYIDKNFSQIFIIWDKLFGTFQEELREVPPVYGITRPANTWNPLKINFQHLWLMLRDAFYARSWFDKLRIWWMPTGWRPADVAEKYPVEKIDDPYNFRKYAPAVSPWLQGWAVMQLVVLLLFSLHYWGNIGTIGSSNIFYYGLFIALSVYSATELMDKNRFSIGWELLRCAVGFSLLYTAGDWFMLGRHWPMGIYFVAAYLMVSFALTCYFVLVEFRRLQNSPANIA
jgi:hypothetical protein